MRQMVKQTEVGIEVATAGTREVTAEGLEDDRDEEGVDDGVLVGVEEVGDVVDVESLTLLVEREEVVVELGFSVDYQSGQQLKMRGIQRARTDWWT